MAASEVTTRHPRAWLPITLTCCLMLGGLAGCSDEVGAVESVEIAGRTFHLEVAADPDTRFKGLSGRTHIEDDGGMLFLFDRPQPLNFVMRDCPIDIDIIFLDGSGRVTATHHMLPEPRLPDEPAEEYEKRLKRYSSKFAAQFVIELKGGTLNEITVKEGDRIPLRLEALKKAAR